MVLIGALRDVADRFVPYLRVRESETAVALLRMAAAWLWSLPCGSPWFVRLGAPLCSPRLLDIRRRQHDAQLGPTFGGCHICQRSALSVAPISGVARVG